MYAGVVFFGGIALLISTYLLWRLLFDLLRTSAVILRAFFGRAVPIEGWMQALYQQLWRLPPGCAAGASLWYGYIVYGSSTAADWMCGFFGALIGAWMFLPVFLQWYRLRRSRSSPSAYL